MEDMPNIEITQVQHPSVRIGDGVGILCCCGLHNNKINSVKAEKEFAANLTKEEIENYYKACIRYMLVESRTDDYVFVYDQNNKEKHLISCIKLIVPVDQE